MHNRNLYEPFNDEQLYRIVHDGWPEFKHALSHELKHGTDSVLDL